MFTIKPDALVKRL